MADYQVLWIQRSLRPSPHECIEQIGGLHADGARWTLTQQQAVAAIETGGRRFHVNIEGRTTLLIVETSVMGHSYLKTRYDSDLPDSLLTLPDLHA